MTKMLLKNDIKSNSRRDFIKASSLTSVSLLIGLNANCLLYTSPSPRDRQKSRMPSSA